MKALVLNSGGVDSTTCVGIAVDKFGKENVATVSVAYGQKHQKELLCATKIAEHYGVKHYELDLSNVLKYSNCSLLQHSTEEVTEGSYAEQLKSLNGHPVSTFVPFRNGLMLSAVASLAGSIFENEEVAIYLGAHADDAAGNAYPDCSEAFTTAMNNAIYEGSDHKVHVEAPLVNMNKATVVKTGLSLNVPYELTWSCYKGGEKPCGKCGTCIDRAKAFEANGIKDPALGE